eukprot:527855-Prorocentrum_minimum.AAC.1
MSRTSPDPLTTTHGGAATTMAHVPKVPMPFNRQDERGHRTLPTLSPLLDITTSQKKCLSSKFQ